MRILVPLSDLMYIPWIKKRVVSLGRSHFVIRVGVLKNRITQVRRFTLQAFEKFIHLVYWITNFYYMSLDLLNSISHSFHYIIVIVLHKFIVYRLLYLLKFSENNFSVGWSLTKILLLPQLWFLINEKFRVHFILIKLLVTLRATWSRLLHLNWIAM